MKPIEDFLSEIDELYRRGKPAEVERRLREELSRRTGREKVTILHELAGYDRGVGRYGEAAALYESVISKLEEAGEGQSAAYATALLNLAGTYRLTGALKRASTTLEEALLLIPDDDYLRAVALNHISLVRQAQGRLSEAETFALWALKWLEYHGAPSHEVATSLGNLAALALRMRELDRAEEYIEGALRIYAQIGRPDPHYGAVLSTKGSICLQKGELEKAEKAFQASMDWTDHFYGHSAEYQIAQENLEIVRRKRREEEGHGPS